MNVYVTEDPKDAIHLVEGLEKEWTSLIQANRRIPPEKSEDDVIYFLNERLHGAYRKIGLQAVLDMKEELSGYRDWLRTVRALTSSEMASQYVFPDCVIVYGTDYLAAGDKIFRCIWKDKWLKIDGKWMCVQVLEESVVDITVHVGQGGYYETLLQSYRTK